MTENELKKSQHRLIVISCIMVFLLFLVVTIVWEINYFSKYDNFKRVECKVIEHYEENGKIYDKFVFQADNQEYVEKITPFESKYEIGEKFHVYYDTETVVEVIYKRDSKVVLLPLVTGIFGLATGGVLTLYIITYKKNKVRK